MSRLKEQVEDMEEWKKHFFEKYGMKLTIALNEALGSLEMNDEEIAHTLGCSVEHVKSMRADGHTASLREIAMIEELSGTQVFYLPSHQNDWIEEALEETERYFEETPSDEVDLDLQKARSGGSLGKLQGAVQMVANMLRRDNRSVREEAAEELEKALSELIDDLSQDS